VSHHLCLLVGAVRGPVQHGVSHEPMTSRSPTGSETSTLAVAPVSTSRKSVSTRSTGKVLPRGEEAGEDDGQAGGPPQQGDQDDGKEDELLVRGEAREVAVRAVAGVGETPWDGERARVRELAPGGQQARRAATADAPLAGALAQEVESSAVDEPSGGRADEEAGIVTYLDMACWMRAVAGRRREGASLVSWAEKALTADYTSIIRS
jgi:hypothetical protein